MRPARFLAALLAVATLGSACPTVTAQETAKPAAGQQPPAAPSPAAPKMSVPGDSLLAGWDRPVVTVLRSPAVLLMTPAEILEFERLDTTARRAFLDRFWAAVAPNCPAGTNPVKDRLNERVTDANARFADEGVPGWVTDRGRVFVLMGPPDKIDSAADVQTWSWAPGGGQARTVRFVRQRLNWRFAGLDPADADARPVPFDVSRLELVAGMRGKGCELTAEQKAGVAQDAWRTKLFELTGQILAGEKPAFANTVEPLFSFFPAADDATFVVLTVPLQTKPAAGEKLVGTLRPEGSETLAYAFGTADVPFEVRESSSGAVAQAVRALAPGRYALGLAFANAEGGVTHVYAGEQIVVRMPQDSLRLTSVILADALKPLEGDQVRAPFRLFGFEVVPNALRTFRTGTPVTLLFAVLGATADGEQKLDLKVTYTIFFNSPKRGWYNPFNQPVGVKPHQAQAVQAQDIPIGAKWPAGKYKFVIEVVDNRTGSQTSFEVPFEVKPAA